MQNYTYKKNQASQLPTTSFAISIFPSFQAYSGVQDNIFK